MASADRRSSAFRIAPTGSTSAKAPARPEPRTVHQVGLGLFGIGMERSVEEPSVYTIYESGQNDGYVIDTFAERFGDILREHERDGRVKAFAFIFYDFEHEDLRRVLSDRGVFTRLDRLSGKEVSIFHLHAGGGSPDDVNKFNRNVAELLGIRLRTPSVVFFKLEAQAVGQVEVHELTSPTLILGFHELHDLVTRYLTGNREANEPQAGTWRRRFRGAAKFASSEAARDLIKLALDPRTYGH